MRSDAMIGARRQRGPQGPRCDQARPAEVQPEPMSEGGTVTVVVARFGGLAGYGLAAALHKDRCVRVLASDLSSAELERTIAQQMPRVAILDEDVEHALLVRLRSRQPATGVLVLTHNPTRLCGTSLLAVGATCLSWSASAVDMLAAIHLAAQGKPTFFWGDGYQLGGGSIAASALTRRETEVFEHLSRGKSYSEIGHILQIAYSTVVSHTRKICEKLNVKSRLELIGMTLETEPSTEAQ